MDISEIVKLVGAMLGGGFGIEFIKYLYKKYKTKHHYELSQTQETHKHELEADITKKELFHELKQYIKEFKEQASYFKELHQNCERENQILKYRIDKLENQMGVLDGS